MLIELKMGYFYFNVRQTRSAKVPSRKGNSPDHKLRALNKCLVLKDLLISKNFWRVGLEAAIS